jgi:VIT1/CCC1 family predicted Fe2+/Mn2+ transporter
MVTSEFRKMASGVPLLQSFAGSEGAPTSSVDGERLTGAKSAYAAGDASLSRAVHQQFQQTVAERKTQREALMHPETAVDEGEFVRPAVFGGLDGVNTSFSLLAGAIGVDLGWSHLIAISCAQVFAGAFGMGFGEYVSARAERQIALRERKREQWEVENYPEGEIAEMIDIYTQNGLSEEDAEQVARTLSKYPKFWVDHMLLHEIGILPPSDTDSSWRSALVMFFSFVLAGSMPILSYILVGLTVCGVTDSMVISNNLESELAAFPAKDVPRFMGDNSGSSSAGTMQVDLLSEGDGLSKRNIDARCLSDYGMDIACIVTFLTLFLLGYSKNKIAEQNAWVGGGAMAFQGAVAGVISYYVGVQIGGATS